VPLAMQEWYHEHQHYNLSAATCDPGQMCGHYTQVRGPEGGASRCWVGPRAGWAGPRGVGWGHVQDGRGLAVLGGATCRMGGIGHRGMGRTLLRPGALRAFLLQKSWSAL
jgi:hypothetical protein